MSVVNSIHRAEIEKRHARRIDIEKEAKKLKPPSIHSKASKSDFQKVVNGLTEKFSEECLMVTHDFKVLIMAMNLMQIMNFPVDEYVDAAWLQCPMSAELQEAIDVRAYEETEAREKAAKNDKRNGELEGQQKIPFDDGSQPEAGECVTYADVTPESHRLTDNGNLGTLDEQVEALPIIATFSERGEVKITTHGPVLPGREITDEEIEQLGGKNITDEQLDADLAKCRADLDKVAVAFVAPEPEVSELAAKVAKKKAAAGKAKAKK